MNYLFYACSSRITKAMITAEVIRMESGIAIFMLLAAAILLLCNIFPPER